MFYYVSHFENEVTTQNAIKNFYYTPIADRLRTVSWSNNNYPSGVDKPVCGRPAFPLSEKAYSIKKAHIGTEVY